VGLRQRWLAAVLARPHLFLLNAPGGAAVRVAVERFARIQGWPVVDAPSDADLLVLTAGPRLEVHPRLVAAADELFGLIPAPKGSVRLTDPTRVGEVLVAARTVLCRPSDSACETGRSVGPGGADTDSELAPTDRSGHSGTTSAVMDHAGMEMPAGLPLAGSAPDRDGLALDVLCVTLGPGLSHWPAGLVLDLTMQGDVVQAAQAQLLGPPPLSASRAAWYDLVAGPETGLAVRRLDQLGRLFAVAGSDRLALAAGRLRDDLIDGHADAGRRAGRLTRSARGDRLLRSMTGRIPVDPDGSVLGLPAPGDVTSCWQLWLSDVEQTIAGTTPVRRRVDLPVVLDTLSRLSVGREWAEVRLLVAALDPDAELAGAPQPAPAGQAVSGDG